MYQVSLQNALPTHPSPLSISRRPPSNKVIDTATKVSRPSKPSISLKHTYTANQIKEAPNHLFSLREEDAKNEEEKMILTLAGLLNQKGDEVTQYQGELKSKTARLRVALDAKAILEVRLKESLEKVEEKQKRVIELEEQLKRERTDKAVVQINLAFYRKELEEETAKCERTQKALVEVSLEVKEQLQEKLSHAQEKLSHAEEQLKLENEVILNLKDEIALNQQERELFRCEMQAEIEFHLQEEEKLKEVIKVLETKIEDYQTIATQNENLIKANNDLKVELIKIKKEASFFKQRLDTVYFVAKSVALIAATILIGSVLVWQYPEYVQKGWLLSKRCWSNLSSFITNLFSPRNDDINRLIFTGRPAR